MLSQDTPTPIRSTLERGEVPQLIVKGWIVYEDRSHFFVIPSVIATVAAAMFLGVSLSPFLGPPYQDFRDVVGWKAASLALVVFGAFAFIFVVAGLAQALGRLFFPSTSPSMICLSDRRLIVVKSRGGIHLAFARDRPPTIHIGWPRESIAGESVHRVFVQTPRKQKIHRPEGRARHDNIALELAFAQNDNGASALFAFFKGLEKPKEPKIVPVRE